MSLKSKYLSKSDKRDRYCVHGFIHEIEPLLYSQQVPQDLNEVIVSFFSCDEYFEEIDKSVTATTILSADRKWVTKNPKYGYWYNACYGKIRIDSKSDKKCQWELKIDCAEKGGAQIGISSEDLTSGRHFLLRHTVEIMYSGREFAVLKYVKYLTGCGTHGWCRHSRLIRPDDVFSVHLDLKNAEMRFYLNDEDTGIIYKYIEEKENVKWRLYAQLRSAGDSVGIIDCYEK